MKEDALRGKMRFVRSKKASGHRGRAGASTRLDTRHIHYATSPWWPHTLVAADAGRGQVLVRGALPLLYEKGRVMKIIKAKDYEDMSRKAANIISAQVILKPDCVLGLATGSTPIGAYKQLAAWYEKGDVDFAEVSTYNLDEYRGLSHDDPQSYHYFMRENFFDHINIDLNNTHVPDGSNPDAAAACSEYDKIVAAAGYPDLQLLGIGNNGHIGFNEPDDHFSKGTHCVDLTESTIQANSRLFDSIDDVPRQAYTMGTQTIMYARMILVVANGEAKAQAVHDMCYGPVTPECPASILQLHTNCVVVADEAALSLCE